MKLENVHRCSSMLFLTWCNILHILLKIYNAKAFISITQSENDHGEKTADLCLIIEMFASLPCQVYLYSTSYNGLLFSTIKQFFGVHAFIPDKSLQTKQKLDNIFRPEKKQNKKPQNHTYTSQYHCVPVRALMRLPAGVNLSKTKFHIGLLF